MKIYFPFFDGIVETNENEVKTVVVEEQNTFRQIAEDIKIQTEEKFDGKCVFSENDKIINASKCCDVISEFAPFKINRKSLINGMINELEKIAENEVFYPKTMSLMGEIEKYIDDITDELSCEVSCKKLSALMLIKAVGLEINEDYENIPEKILDYMDLMMDICRTKLFITVNMRSFFDSKTVQLFCDSVLSHKIPLVMLEAVSHSMLKNEKRITVDKDLCVF